MGNISSIGGAPQQVVRLVRQDGKVLEFYNDMAVEELLVVYPKYVVCQDQVLENGQVRRKMLTAKDVLLKGQVYILLHLPAHQPQQRASQQSHGQKVAHHGQQKIYGNGVNGTTHRVPKIHPIDVPTAGREHSAHPPQQELHQQKKFGVAVKPVFPKVQIDKILESGSVKIITKNGTARLSGPQLTRLLSEASSHGSYAKSSTSPVPASLSLMLESIPEEPHSKTVAL